MFKYLVGQEVWCIDKKDGKAMMVDIYQRKLTEDEEGTCIVYSLTGAGDKSESQLFSTVEELMIDFLSYTHVEYVIELPDGKEITNKSKLSDLCGSFIDDNEITSKRAIMERVGLTEKAIKLIEKICDTIGYYEGKLDDMD